MCTNPPRPDGTACNDGSACTQTDTCMAGVCTGMNPVTCPAPPDACHDNGVCNPMTGACSFPFKADGTACDDGNPCTQMDTCQMGVCHAGAPMQCPAPDGCHDTGASARSRANSS